MNKGDGEYKRDGEYMRDDEIVSTKEKCDVIVL